MFSRVTWKKCSFLLIGAILISLSGCSGRITQAKTNKDNESSSRGNSYLDKVKERGYLICGISGEIPGFSFVDFTGRYAGIDVDFCRAVSSALFNDPDQVKFRELDADTRFEALKSGKIDLLSRNTTQTFSRDTDGDIEFTPPIFYDYQGIMVFKNSGINNPKDLNNKSICVAEGTTSYDNLQDYMSQRQIDYTPVAMSDKDALFDSYEHNRCQAITGDASQLVARQVLLANSADHKILPQSLGQEPLAPAVLHRDSQWFDAIKWVSFALIQAEELNINSANLNSYKNGQDTEIKSFLGIGSTFGSEMGLSDDFVLRIIKHVGNYQQIYDRNLGKPFGLKRGENALWNDGGLMYSPPFN